MMAKVDQFLYDLVYYDKENIHPDVIKVRSRISNHIEILLWLKGKQKNISTYFL